MIRIVRVEKQYNNISSLYGNEWKLISNAHMIII